jgi:hypothetical protein
VDRKAWIANLRQCAHPAKLILLTSEPVADWGNDEVAMVPKIRAAPAILELLHS